jgi:asparagine synthase (glutamine-hydrolysing)
VDMANSMESRPAFLDHYLAEVAVKVSPHHRIHGNIEKWVLREAVKGVLPEVLYKREKFAFMAPPAHTDKLKQQLLKNLLDRFVADEHVRAAGIFDPRRLRAFIDGYHADSDPVSLVRKDALINHILCLQILYRQYLA